MAGLLAKKIVDLVTDPFVIREATISDLDELVRLHVTSWNATYPSFYPKPSPELRKAQWEKTFSTKQNNWFCYVVEKHPGIVGFSTGEDFHHEELPFKGHLNKIHFYKEYHRLGFGTKLMARVVDHFLERGIDSMILFADPGNPNIAFYDKLQGERLLDKEGIFQGAYGWHDLQGLASLCRGMVDG